MDHLFQRLFYSHVWQAHLQRISPYLQHGEGVWWKAIDGGYQFLDSDKDAATHPCGPTLSHYRNTSIQDVWDLSRAVWKSILDSKTTLPTPYIRLFEDDNYVGRHYFPSTNDDCNTSGTNEDVLGLDNDQDTSQVNSSQCLTPDTTQNASQTTPHTSTRTSTHIHPLNLLSKLNTSTTDTDKIQPEESSTDGVPLEDDVASDDEEASPAEMEQDAILCEVAKEIDSDHEMFHDRECHDLQSKAAIQISKVIGHGEILKEYDTLRVNLKKKSSKKGYKPSPSDRKHYNKLLSQVHTEVLSTKHKLKAEIKYYETNYYCKHGMLPSNKEKDYGDLRRKLDYVRKLLSLWHKFDL